jgi:hypothetical protein
MTRVGFRRANVRLKKGHGYSVRCRSEADIDIKGQQLCKGAPWFIKVEDVAAFSVRQSPKRPLTPNPAQQTFDFQ